MFARTAIKVSAIILGITLGLPVCLCANAGAAAEAEPGGIAVLHDVLDRARALGSETNDAMSARAAQQGSIPVIVRLRDHVLSSAACAAGSVPQQEDIHLLQNEVLDSVFAKSGRDETSLKVKRFSMIPAMALQVDADELGVLLRHPDVVDVIEDVPVPPDLQDSLPLIGADVDGSFSGLTGAGQAIAILDTGVDKNHPMLQGKVVSEACYSSNVPSSGATSLCPNGSTSSTAKGSGMNCDLSAYGCDHGTHVAGIAAGSGSMLSGVAKDASIIAIQVFSRFDNPSYCSVSNPCVLSYTSDQIKALERVYALRNTYAIAAANMSLGAGYYSAPCNLNSLKPAIDSLRVAGIATVISSGNNSYTDALGAPACIASAVSVGSTTKQDEVSAFSNSAWFLSLLAPGSQIQSCVPLNGYGYKSGTSMAAPHVTGAWAVLKQSQPQADVTEVLGALTSTGVPVTDVRAGAGSRISPRIDLQSALDSLRAPGDWLRWDDGVQNNAVGLTEGGTLTVASRWQPGDMPDGLITKMRIGIFDAPASAALHIWQGSDAASLQLCYTQQFIPAGRQTNEIVLDTAYSVDTSRELWFGWSATHSPGQYPCALDAATDTGRKGNMIWSDNTWQNFSLPGDWLAHAFRIDCMQSADCPPGYSCQDDVCVEDCRLTVRHNKIRSAKLFKPRKIRMKITGSDDFDPFGGIDIGPLEILRTKVKIRRNILRIKALVPAGLPAGKLTIRVGDCYGEVEIL